MGIILPSCQGGLKLFKWGVKNCGKSFAAQSEKSLLDHMETTHGAYYIKVGKGKYILRLCRICGEEKTFASDVELTNHIAVGHPVDQFGEKLDDSDDDQAQSNVAGSGLDVEVKQEPQDDIEELASNVPVPGTTTQGIVTPSRPTQNLQTPSRTIQNIQTPSKSTPKTDPNPGP